MLGGNDICTDKINTKEYRQNKENITAYRQNTSQTVVTQNSCLQSGGSTNQHRRGCRSVGTHHELHVVEAIGQQVVLVLDQADVVQPLSHGLHRTPRAYEGVQRKPFEQRVTVHSVAAAVRLRQLTLPHHVPRKVTVKGSRHAQKLKSGQQRREDRVGGGGGGGVGARERGGRDGKKKRESGKSLEAGMGGRRVRSNKKG